MAFQTLTLLGSTGSIGTQTLDILRHLKGEIQVLALSATGRRLELMASQIEEFQPQVVHLADPGKADPLRERLGTKWSGEIVTGPEGLIAIARDVPADLVLVATVGWTGLDPALAAIKAGRHIALANKEVLVCGGHLVMKEIAQRKLNILPVDSEHNAIHQCLAASPQSVVKRLVLTCSGGPFRQADQKAIMAATSAQTLDHPTWDMGSKITVDSATLMNKGFEVIEAHHLFGVPYDQIEVVIHPQSTVHSMVEFVDGSILAQLGQTDMRLPIQYALTWPERVASPLPPLDLTKVGPLEFSPPDLERFPCLMMAYEAGKLGGSVPCVLNAANEVAVAKHLEDQITCGQIATVVSKVLEKHSPITDPDLDTLRQADQWARRVALEVVGRA
jgi:1-deoxy-D-xylulose-5-phosphate reductoisomerase